MESIRKVGKLLKIHIYFPLCIITLIICSGRAEVARTSFTDSTCVFKDDGKLFTLTVLNKIEHGHFYSIVIDANRSIVFNFCDPFTPQ